MDCSNPPPPISLSLLSASRCHLRRKTLIIWDLKNEPCWGSFYTTSNVIIRAQIYHPRYISLVFFQANYSGKLRHRSRSGKLSKSNLKHTRKRKKKRCIGERVLASERVDMTSVITTQDCIWPTVLYSTRALLHICIIIIPHKPQMLL